MSKTHFINQRRQSPYTTLNEYYWIWVVCGISVINWDATDDANEVTCKNCLRVMEKREKEKHE